MGELLGVPEWLAVTLWVGLGITAFLLFGSWTIRRAHERVAANRPNPSKQQFLGAMKAHCSAEVSEFLWEKALYYVGPRLTPHPDDHLIRDLNIDDDDIALDWPRDWAERRGFHPSNLPDWPKEWPATIRNIGRWLDMGPQ
jgi:uncharacterized protein YneF (UPF0154 family)